MRAGAFRTRSPLMSSSLLAGKAMCDTYASTSCCVSGIAPGLRGEPRARYRALAQWGCTRVSRNHGPRTLPLRANLSSRCAVLRQGVSTDGHWREAVPGPLSRGGRMLTDRLGIAVVYKGLCASGGRGAVAIPQHRSLAVRRRWTQAAAARSGTVSYTHLTLPTILRV